MGGLTPEQIVDELARCGFAVAPRPFYERRHHAQRGNSHYSIDFATGLVNLWGTVGWRPVADVVAELDPERQLDAAEADLDQAEAIAAAAPIDVEPAAPKPMPLRPWEKAWLDRCVAAGFVIVDGPRPPAANVEATFEGRPFVLLPWTGSILGPGFSKRTLADFEPPVEIVTTGRNKQANLFELCEA